MEVWRVYRPVVAQIPIDVMRSRIQIRIRICIDPQPRIKHTKKRITPATYQYTLSSQTLSRVFGGELKEDCRREYHTDAGSLKGQEHKINKST